MSCRSVWLRRSPSRQHSGRCVVLALGGGALFAVLSTALAFAQLPGGLPGAVTPGRDRPLPEVPAQPNFDFTIQAPSRLPIPRAVDEVHFTLRDIHVDGAVTLPAERFRPLYQNLIGKDVTLADIFDIADRIEQEYRRAGYILTRAYVPPQRVADGVFTISLVEGFVASTSVEGGGATIQDLIRAYLKPVIAEKPLSLSAIERALLLSNDVPGVAATGVLRPSPDTQGASDLIVTATETPLTGGVSLDNRGSHFSGIWSVTGYFALNSLLGDADQLSGTVSTATDPSKRIAEQIRYRRLIGTDGMMASVFVSVTKGQPGSTLRVLNVLTQSWAVGPRLSYPILRTRAETLVLDGGFTVQDARVRVLGHALSHDQWRVADIGFSYARSGFLGGAWAGNVDLAQGLEIAGATSDNSPELSRAGANTHFTKLVGGIRHTRALVGPLSLTVAVQGQYAFSRLIIGEQVAFGGTQIGRGYEPGAVTGDHGVGGSVELRYDSRLPQLSIMALQPYVYFDTAKGWFMQSGPDLSQSLASVGAGIRVSLPSNISAGVEIARTLDHVPSSDNGKLATKVLFDAAVRF